MDILKIEGLFSELNKKDIICWGSGKHFKNITYPFLCESGLIDRLRGFLDTTGKGNVVLNGKEYERIRKSDLYSKNNDNTVILIAVTGYREIQTQLLQDDCLASAMAIPAIYLESLYEDLRMLSVVKPEMNYRKNIKPVISKVIHTFWFSNEELPIKYKKCLNSWKKYAPDFEIKMWNLDSYKPVNCMFFDQAIEDRNWAFASDYARADVLRRYGGVYMDLDVEILRPIDDLLYNDAYMSFESLTRIECGSGMGFKAGNKILDEICKSYENRPYYKADGSWDNSTCPVRYTEIIEKHGLQKSGCFQFVDDITIYPFEVLTCKSFDTGIIYNSELSYTIHHHNGSWIPSGAKDAMENRYKEIENFLSEFCHN